MNFVFFGTPKVASDTLEILKSHGFLPSLIVTAPDKPQGRKMIITPPPVKVWAIENNIPILQPEKLDEEFNLKLSAVSCQLFIVVAYGKIFPEWLISMPELGTLNIHYSLLPKYRGAAPVQYAILNGETETGVTIQKMVKELDAGPIIAQEKTEIGPDEKTPKLLDRLIKIGGELLAKTLPDYIEGKIKPIEQDHTKVTLAPKINKEDGLIKLSGREEVGPLIQQNHVAQCPLKRDPRSDLEEAALAIKNYNKFRAYYDWPRIYFYGGKRSDLKEAPRSDLEEPAAKRIIITNAELKDGKFIIKKIIPEGEKEQDYKN